MDVDKCRDILKTASSGVLALSGDDGYPYAVPVSFVYDGGALWFHGARSGHRPEAARREPRCSFCVVVRDDVDPDNYTTHYASVIAFGRISEVTDEPRRRRAVEALARKYNPGDSAEHRQKAIDDEYAAMTLLRLDIEHLTGKENG